MGPGPQGASSAHLMSRSVPRKAFNLTTQECAHWKCDAPGEGDLEEKPAEALEKGLELFSKEFWDSRSLHHVRGEGASLGDMFHWSHGSLTLWQIMKLAQSRIFFDGNTAWDFSKSWLLSLRSIEIMRKKWAKCPTSRFASHAALSKTNPVTSLEWVPSKYMPSALLHIQVRHREHNVKNWFWNLLLLPRTLCILF